MSKKTFALILIVALGISSLCPVLSAEENILPNGNFSSIVDGFADNWKAGGDTTGISFMTSEATGYTAPPLGGNYVNIKSANTYIQAPSRGKAINGIKKGQSYKISGYYKSNVNINSFVTVYFYHVNDITSTTADGLNQWITDNNLTLTGLAEISSEKMASTNDTWKAFEYIFTAPSYADIPAETDMDATLGVQVLLRAYNTADEKLCYAGVTLTEYNNLLPNGGFEIEGASAADAYGWVKNTSGTVTREAGSGVDGTAALKMSSLSSKAGQASYTFGRREIPTLTQYKLTFSFKSTASAKPWIQFVYSGTYDGDTNYASSANYYCMVRYSGSSEVQESGTLTSSADYIKTTLPNGTASIFDYVPAGTWKDYTIYYTTPANAFLTEQVILCSDKNKAADVAFYYDNVKLVKDVTTLTFCDSDNTQITSNAIPADRQIKVKCHFVSESTSTESGNILLAIYKEVNGIKTLYSLDSSGTGTAALGTPGNFESQLCSIPENTANESYSVSAMLWDNLNTIKPIRKRITLQ